VDSWIVGYSYFCHQSGFINKKQGWRQMIYNKIDLKRIL